MNIIIITIADARGHIGPFQMAIVLTIVSFVLILGWSENYGHAHAETPTKNTSGTSAMLKSVKDSLDVIYSNPAILCLGLSQAFFEGAVYTFGKSRLLL